MIKLEELSTIVAETIADTQEDLSDLLTFVQRVAKVTLLVAEALEGVQLTSSTRSLVSPREDALVWKIAATYRERQPA